MAEKTQKTPTKNAQAKKPASKAAPKTKPKKETKPSHRATQERRDTVGAMSAYGIPQKEIANCLDIDVKTLRKHYREELDTACAKANAAIAGKLYKKAINGDVRSMIFWLKTRGRWSTKIEVENTGIVGNVPLAPDKDFNDPMEAAKFYKEMVKDL